MKAVRFTSFGDASDVLEYADVQTPNPGDDEVRVKLESSAVNPSDIKKRAGANPALLDNGPVIPHSDGAGIIDKCGPGVPASRIGERVYVYQGQFGRSMGTAAEYICIDSRRAVQLPENTDFDTGACIGIPMMTAHRCIFADGPVKDKVLLITGAAGRVGSYAVQWAVRGGARVLATASNDADAQICRDIGAEMVFNHRKDGWGDEISSYLGNESVGRVIDVEFGANLPEVLKCIATGGYIATYSSTQVPEPVLPFRKMMFMDITIRMVIVYNMPEEAKDQAVADIDEVLKTEAFSHRIDRKFPLSRCDEAHKLLESGKTHGVVLLSPYGYEGRPFHAACRE